eukprot:9967708-Prorocentrum_lima.AAC.1
MDNPYAAIPGTEGTPAAPKAGALLRPKAAAQGGASAPPSSSTPLTTTWTRVLSDGDGTGHPPGSPFQPEAPLPWTRAGPPSWANSDVEED